MFWFTLVFFVISVKLNGNRTVIGILRGFDPFMNLVLDEALEDVSPTQKNNIGMVVCHFFFYSDLPLLEYSSRKSLKNLCESINNLCFCNLLESRKPFSCVLT